MNAIWKFPFEITDDFEIFMPKGAQLLSVAMQGDVPCIWAIVDPAAPKEMRKFHLSGTGHELDEQYTKALYVGSFQMKGGALVFHLFWE
jgi:hypothetical protein